jgi:hypothetical protein
VAAGRLDRTIGGLSIVGAGEIDANDTAAQTIEYGYVFDDVRRSVYTPAFRNRRPVLFEAFDFADINASSGGRQASTVAVQALFLANDPFVVEQSASWAARILADPATSVDDSVGTMYREAFARPPSSDELAAARGFLSAQTALHGGDFAIDPRQPAAWADLAHAIINAKEFIFVP